MSEKIFKIADWCILKIPPWTLPLGLILLSSFGSKLGIIGVSILMLYAALMMFGFWYKLRKMNKESQQRFNEAMEAIQNLREGTDKIPSPEEVKKYLNGKDKKRDEN